MNSKITIYCTTIVYHVELSAFFRWLQHPGQLKKNKHNIYQGTLIGEVTSIVPLFGDNSCILLSVLQFLIQMCVYISSTPRINLNFHQETKTLLCPY